MIDFLSSSIFGGYVFNKFTDGMEHLKTSLKEKMMSDAEIETIKTVLEDATEQDLNNEESIKNFLESKLDKSKFDPVIKMRFNKPLNFIGREKDLKNLRESLEQDNKAVLVNGLGGVGKSTLAKEFYCESLGKYENAIWLDFQESIENTVFTFPHLEKLTQEKIEDPKRAFEKFKYALGELSGKNLLILDNVNNPQDLKQCKNIFLPNWTVLITSRASVTEGFNKVDLDVLGVEKARELFYSYYEVEKNDEIVDKILEKIYRHTLLIELTAKMGNIGSVVLTELLENVEKYGTKISKKIPIKTEIEHSEQKRVLIHKYIKEIFDTSELSKKEIHLLTNFTVLPSIHIDLDFFIELYGKDKYKTMETLYTLCEKGWIQKIDDRSYFLHQTLQEVLKEKLKPTVKGCKNLVGKVIKLTRNTLDKNIQKSVTYLPYCYSLENNISSKKSKEIFQILGNISSINLVIGDLQKALYYQNLAKNIGENIFDDESEEVATVYGSLSLIYRNLGNLEESLEYQKKNIDFFLKNYVEENIGDLAVGYGNLAELYRYRGDLEEALFYQLRSIAIFEEIYQNQNNPYLAISYGNLSLIYIHLGNLEDALYYQGKKIEIFKNFEDKNHPELAIAYGNLAEIYKKMGCLEEALQYQRNKIEIFKSFGNEKHPQLAIAYGNLSLAYLSNGESKKALKYQIKKVEIYRSYGNENHLELMIAYSNLATIYNKLYDSNKYKHYLQKAYEIYEFNFPEGNSIYQVIEDVYRQVFKEE